jgi:DNA-binding transcriptional regulator YdaS (Cro superfamily)
MNLSDYLSQERGRAAALAHGLGIKPPSVTAWIKGKKPIPICHGAQIEQLTGGQVTRQEMFPDWERHWPELIPKRRKKVAAQPETEPQ